MIRRSAIVLAVLLLAVVVRAAEHTSDSLDKVKQRLAGKKAVLIDVREPAEWKRGHLQAATLVPLSELKRIDADPDVQKDVRKRLPEDRIIYCHCASGVRVLTAADILGKLGYDVRPLSAGYNELREAGFPVAPSP